MKGKVYKTVVREARVRWSGHAQRRDRTYIDRRTKRQAGDPEEDQRGDLWM